MTLDEIRDAIKGIRERANDDEMAHADEDVLFAEVLRSIAAGTCEDPQSAAELALTSLDIEFARWCA